MDLERRRFEVDLRANERLRPIGRSWTAWPLRDLWAESAGKIGPKHSGKPKFNLKVFSIFGLSTTKVYRSRKLTSYYMQPNKVFLVMNFEHF